MSEHLFDECEPDVRSRVCELTLLEHPPCLLLYYIYPLALKNKRLWHVNDSEVAQANAQCFTNRETNTAFTSYSLLGQSASARTSDLPDEDRYFICALI